MHVSSALDAIKKRGSFKAYKEAHEAWVEQHEVAKQAKATLALFMAPTSKAEKASDRASEKEPAKKSSENAALANTPAPELCDEYQALYDKATFAKETAKNKREAAATNMFHLYANLLSSDAKYTWSKIVREQMEADPFKDLQGSRHVKERPKATFA
jgi:hypothetical protein